MALVEITAPTSGSIVSVLTAQGDRVSEGQELLIIESMKMEIPVEATVAGVIVQLMVSEKSPIDIGDVLVTLEGD
jgi:acetyl-CoA carboxylase biotin carboxyl carrier protein